MPNENQQFVTKEEFNKLKSELDQLNQLTFKNNFSSSQSFTKDAIFSSRLRVPIYTSAPKVGEIGDIIAVAGKLYICTTAGDVATPATFTLVGSQT